MNLVVFLYLKRAPGDEALLFTFILVWVHRLVGDGVCRCSGGAYERFQTPKALRFFVFGCGYLF
ncbi:hypothetical protein HQ51_0212430 [Bacillus altitudinis]|nr:hypothetical protein AS196_17700 [Bacillus sp. TH007]KWZ65845.1 hypothetical protein HQ51_0212430 [Bacillus altitudinis]